VWLVVVVLFPKPGLVFCEKCSLRTLLLPQLSPIKPQRVCDECFLLRKTFEVLALIDALPAPPQETSTPPAPADQHQEEHHELAQPELDE
jgi:hypothetical protein